MQAQFKAACNCASVAPGLGIQNFLPAGAAGCGSGWAGSFGAGWTGIAGAGLRPGFRLRLSFGFLGCGCGNAGLGRGCIHQKLQNLLVNRYIVLVLSNDKVKIKGKLRIYIVFSTSLPICPTKYTQYIPNQCICRVYFILNIHILYTHIHIYTYTYNL